MCEACLIRIDGNFAQAASRAARRQLTVAYCTVRRAASREASRAARRQRDCSGGADSKRATRSGATKVFTLSPAGKFFTLTSEACRALGFLCLGFARVLRALPAHMLCALHTILVLVTMRLGCDASTLAKRPTSCVAHMHAHVQGCLDIGLCAACQHRCRATGSRMHARGLFT